MRILYLAQYFPPEIGASQIRALEMCRGLVRAGHSVTVIAEIPNHPTGIIPPEYKRTLLDRKTEDGIDIIRVWIKASPVKTFRSRLLFYLSYMFSAAVTGLFLTRGKYDLIFSTSPPLFGGGAGLIISYLRRTPFVFELLDLWPQAAVIFNELNNPRYIRWATWLEESCYKRALKIVVTAQEHADQLEKRGLPSDKLTLIRNGSNTDIFFPDKDVGDRIREELGLEIKFLVVYPGLHGLAYDLHGLIDVAASLQSVPDIHFLLIGDGPTKQATVSYAEKLDLSNISFLPQQPVERVPDFFNAADVIVAPLRKPQVPGGFPVKVYDSMACAVPVIVCADGEPRHFVEETQSGLVTEPMDQAGLRHSIMQLRDDPELRARLGNNGREAAVAKYSRQAQAAELAKLLENAVRQT